MRVITVSPTTIVSKLERIEARVAGKGKKALPERLDTSSLMQKIRKNESSCGGSGTYSCCPGY